MKGGDKVITASITFYNLSSLHDAENPDNKMHYSATIYIENQPFRTMNFNRLESAQKFVNMYLEENKNHDA